MKMFHDVYREEGYDGECKNSFLTQEIAHNFMLLKVHLLVFFPKLSAASHSQCSAVDLLLGL